jgi:hypothetical protein
MLSARRRLLSIPDVRQDFIAWMKIVHTGENRVAGKRRRQR